MKRIAAGIIAAMIGITLLAPAAPAQAVTASYCPAKTGKTLYKTQSGFKSWAGKTIADQKLCIYRVKGKTDFGWYLTPGKGVTSQAYAWTAHNKHGGIIFRTSSWTKIAGNSGTYHPGSGVTMTEFQFKVVKAGVHYYSTNFYLHS